MFSNQLNPQSCFFFHTVFSGIDEYRNGENSPAGSLCTITVSFFVWNRRRREISFSSLHTTANAMTPTLTHLSSNFGCVLEYS